MGKPLLFYPTMAQALAALGFRAHSGWAVLAAAGGQAGAPMVLLRRRVDLADPAIRGSVQPYHAAAQTDPREAAGYIGRCARSTSAMAQRAVRAAVEELHRKSYRVSGCCVLEASGRPLPDLASILAAHPLIHTAEGVFFRQSLKEACAACGLPVVGIKERDLLDQAAARLCMSTADLLRRAAEMGKGVGPPWRQDEKLSAIAAWLVLTDSVSR